jgi:hypothetical protein
LKLLSCQYCAGNFVVNEEIAKRSKPYSDGKFVDMLCLNNYNDMHTISLPRRSLNRHNDEFASGLEQCLRDRTSKFEVISLAIDESTDVSGTAKLAVLVHGAHAEFSVTEKWYSTKAGHYY